MPTIDELPQANSVSDSDELVVSQSDIARKATRAQLLAGVQPALALPQNVLLGRISAGTGSPEDIGIGANLTVANGSMSAPAPFVVSALPAASPPQAGDLVAVAQGGQNAAQGYAALMGGLGELTGISGSNLVAMATGGLGSRRIGDMFADAISIESFGAVGDGATDDTAAFLAAAQASRPIRLDGRVYIVNGPLLMTTAVAWLGVAGGTVVRRAQATTQQPWIEFAGVSVFATGVIFDANLLAAVDSPAVQIDSSCETATVSWCQFLNAVGANTGHGLAIICGDNAVHEVTSCRFSDNALDGCTVSGTGTVAIRDCIAQGNKGNGIGVATETACRLSRNVCIANGIGISIGAWQTAAGASAAPPSCLVDENICSGNTTWGLAVGGNAASVQNNSAVSNGLLGTGGGIIARLGTSRLACNQVSGGIVGIDARTSWSSVITANHVAGTATGLLLGGCQNVSVSDNFLISNQWSMDVSAIEPSLSYGLTGPVSIVGNWIGFTLAQGGGIYVHDGCLGVSILGNDFNGWGSATVGQALWLHTDEAIVSRNSWNNQAVFTIQSGTVGVLSTLIFPDIADEALVTSAANPIASLLTSHQADTLGQISFIRVDAGGSGYTSAQILISGSGGGATAQAVINEGQIAWIIITNPGSGYGGIGAAATVVVNGDGNGAAATAYVGLPVLQGRHLRLSCNCTVQLAVASTSPTQQNWTNYAATVPAFGAIEIEGVPGSWRAVAFPAIDYVLPTGDGGAVLQSVAGGDITLRPSAGGVLQIASAAEPTGCTSSVGRGAPTGAIAAPPGSDFRNLNGGAGNTFWVKQTGTDANGWIAIA